MSALERAQRCQQEVVLPNEYLAYGLCVAPNGSFVLVGRGRTVYRVNFTTQKVTHTYQGFKCACGVALTPDGLEALVADCNGSRVGRVQLATGHVDFPFGGDGEFKNASDVDVADDGSFALVTNYGNGTVGRIDFATTLPLPPRPRPQPYSGFSNPTGVAISPGRSFALVSCYGDNTLRRLELATGAVTAVFKGFNAPRGVAFSPDGAWALVANQGGNNVGLIDLASGVVTFPAALSGLAGVPFRGPAPAWRAGASSCRSARSCARTCSASRGRCSWCAASSGP
jgi:DNA-binding beta-propeller fold protein YncE